MYGMFSVWALFCLDGLDATKLRAGEHIGRRLMQIDRACKTSRGKPMFDGLGILMRHAEGAIGTPHMPAWDRYLASAQRDEALVAKNRRLLQEEQDAAAKAPKPKKGAKGKKGGGDDDE